MGMLRLESGFATPCETWTWDADCELLIVMESVRVSLELRVPERLILPLFDRDGLAECVTD